MAAPILGTNNHLYEAHHDWGELPASLAWGNTHAVQVDSQGLIYIAHTVHETSTSDHAIAVFDPDGKFVTSWGGQFAGGAHGLQLVREGSEEFFYISDIRRCIVQKTTLTGEVLLTFGYPTESPRYQRNDQRIAPYWKPTNVAVASSGHVYIADGYGVSCILVYDSEGKYLNTFGGGLNDGPGELSCSHGITIDRRSGAEEILVADRFNHRLQYFDLEGNHLRYGGLGILDLPCHFDRGPEGELLIPDLARRVTLLDGHDELITHIGEGLDDWMERREKPREDFHAGRFICPHGACFDPNGDVFVTEWVEVGRVTKLVRVR